MGKAIALLFLVVGVATVVLGCAMTIDPNGNVSFALVLPTIPPPIVVAEPIAEPVPEAVVEVPVVEEAPVVEAVDYVGVSTPVEVVAYPGVPFYPRYVEACDCIWTVGFVDGVWINDVGVVVVHEGGWRHPSMHALTEHREALRRNPNMYHRAGALEHREQQQHATPQQHEQKPQPASQQVKPEQKAQPKQQVKPQQQQKQQQVKPAQQQQKQQPKPQQQQKPQPKQKPCSDADRKQSKCH
jgi:hypothetical protein